MNLRLFSRAVGIMTRMLMWGFSYIPRRVRFGFLKAALTAFWYFRIQLSVMVALAYEHNLPKHFSDWGSIPFLLKHIASSDSVLDLGCSDGRLTARIGEHAKSVVGVDIDQGSIDSANQLMTKGNVRFICTNAEDDLPKGKFDIVVMSSFITFAQDPVAFLSRLQTVTSKLLIRETRFDDNYLVLVSRDLGVSKQPWREFTWDQLKILLISSGWRIEEEWQTFDIFVMCRSFKKSSAAE